MFCISVKNLLRFAGNSADLIIAELKGITDSIHTGTDSIASETLEIISFPLEECTNTSEVPVSSSRSGRTCSTFQKSARVISEILEIVLKEHS